MADYTLNLAADFANRTTVDANVKLVDGAGPPALEVALWQDLFNAALDGHWTEGTYLAFTEGATAYSESAGKGHIVVPGSGANGNYRAKAIKSPAVFNDITVEVEASNWGVAGEAVNTDGAGIILLHKDNNNYVAISRVRAVNGNVNKFSFYEVLATVYTEHASFASTATSFDFKLVRSGNDFSAYYDIGAGWVQLGSTEAIAIGADCTLQLAALIDIGTISIDFDNMLVDGSDYWWDDSPECDIIDSSA